MESLCHSSFPPTALGSQDDEEEATSGVVFQDQESEDESIRLKIFEWRRPMGRVASDADCGAVRPGFEFRRHGCL
ncbi:hypothetical protein TNCV_1077131 [Trichonephila clavipes]|uniref:Uncharacterized protein n=1 Tax=Trichonephila clavipes TaxID=2585209 RepID=A0A8X6RQT7_TRICX|nr:hypothetical protein TNCV_1077131 [Trichonephila clavipes]